MHWNYSVCFREDENNKVTQTAQSKCSSLPVHIVSGTKGVCNSGCGLGSTESCQTMMSCLPVLLRKCYLLNSQQSHPNTHTHSLIQTHNERPAIYNTQLWTIQTLTRWENDEGSALWASQTEKEILSIRARQRHASNPPSFFSLALSLSFSFYNADLSDLGKQFNDHC